MHTVGWTIAQLKSGCTAVDVLSEQICRARASGRTKTDIGHSCPSSATAVTCKAAVVAALLETYWHSIYNDLRNLQLLLPKTMQVHIRSCRKILSSDAWPTELSQLRLVAMGFTKLVSMHGVDACYQLSGCSDMVTWHCRAAFPSGMEVLKLCIAG
eukprot:3002916-Amphidinium_carterae.1